MANHEIFVSALFALITLLCVQVILMRYRDYQNTKYKFKFYALRDNLALLVLNGTVKETEREYILLRDAINYSIFASENMSIRQHITAMLSATQPTPQNLITFKHAETKLIAINYFIATIAVVRKNSWFEIKVIGTAMHLFSRIFLNSEKSVSRPIDHRSIVSNKPKYLINMLEESQNRLAA